MKKREGEGGGREGLQLACAQCIEMVLKARPLRIRGALERKWVQVCHGVRDMMGGGLMAQIVQVCLILAESGGDRSLVQACLGCLEGLMLMVTNRDAWRRVLPGMFGGLYKVIYGVTRVEDKGSGGAAAAAERQGRMVPTRQGGPNTEAAFDLWVKLLVVTFGDKKDDNTGGSDALALLAALADGAGSAGDEVPSNTKSDEWTTTALPKVAAMLPRAMAHVRSHSVWGVRRAAARGALTLLTTCPASLEAVRSSLLDTLLALLWDQQPRVQE
ncbi:unnamed protein product, partial [Chrysoparadoxa australica]